MSSKNIYDVDEFIRHGRLSVTEDETWEDFARRLQARMIEHAAHVTAIQNALQSLFPDDECADMIERRVQLYLPYGHPNKTGGAT